MLNFTLDQQELIRSAADIIDINGKCHGKYYDDNIVDGNLIRSYCVEGALHKAYSNRYNIHFMCKGTPAISKIINIINIYLENYYISSSIFSFSDNHTKDVVVDALKAIADNNEEKALEIINA